MMIRQNEALDVSFSKMLITGSFKVAEVRAFQKSGVSEGSFDFFVIFDQIFSWTKILFFLFDLYFFSLDHIEQVVIQFSGLDHDHFDFDDMIFLIRIQ